MPQFEHVPHPVFSPTHCVFCMGNREARGFVDTGHTDPFGHRTYICAKCVDALAAKVGCLTPEARAKLEAANTELKEKLARAGSALAEALENRVVALADVKAELAKAKPKTPAAA